MRAILSTVLVTTLLIAGCGDLDEPTDPVQPRETKVDDGPDHSRELTDEEIDLRRTQQAVQEGRMCIGSCERRRGTYVCDPRKMFPTGFNGCGAYYTQRVKDAGYGITPCENILQWIADHDVDVEALQMCQIEEDDDGNPYVPIDSFCWGMAVTVTRYGAHLRGPGDVGGYETDTTQTLSQIYPNPGPPVNVPIDQEFTPYCHHKRLDESLIRDECGDEVQRGGTWADCDDDDQPKPAAQWGEITHATASIAHPSPPARPGTPAFDTWLNRISCLGGVAAVTASAIGGGPIGITAAAGGALNILPTCLAAIIPVPDPGDPEPETLAGWLPIAGDGDPASEQSVGQQGVAFDIPELTFPDNRAGTIEADYYFCTRELAYWWSYFKQVKAVPGRKVAGKCVPRPRPRIILEASSMENQGWYFHNNEPVVIRVAEPCRLAGKGKPGVTQEELDSKGLQLHGDVAVKFKDDTRACVQMPDVGVKPDLGQPDIGLDLGEPDVDLPDPDVGDDAFDDVAPDAPDDVDAGLDLDMGDDVSPDAPEDVDAQVELDAEEDAGDDFDGGDFEVGDDGGDDGGLIIDDGGVDGGDDADAPEVGEDVDLDLGDQPDARFELD